MKALYFVRPIGQMFNFKGSTGRAEYFTYTVTSFLSTSAMVLIAIVVYTFLPNLNWHVILPPEILNERGSIDMPWQEASNPMAFFNLMAVFWCVSQLPMVALTVRRLRDQYAPASTVIWMLVPFLGMPVLFCHGFAPTFHDHQVTLPDGSTVWRSQQLDSRRRRMAIVGVGMAVGAAGAYQSMQGEGMRLEGDKKTGVNRNASAFKSDGTINNRTSILGGRRAHMRNGRSVRASRNKYKW